MVATWSGLVSKSTTRDGGRSASARTRRPGLDAAAEGAKVSGERAGDRGRPALGDRPGLDVRGEQEEQADGGADRPASAAGSSGRRSRRAARGRARRETTCVPRTVAGSSAGTPKPASRSGCRGRCAGPRISAISSSRVAEQRADRAAGTPRRPVRAPLGGRVERLAQDDRRLAVERVGDRRRRLDPGAARARRAGACERYGERMPSGCAAEQTSWWNPGRVSSAVRVPPPMCRRGFERRAPRRRCEPARRPRPGRWGRCRRRRRPGATARGTSTPPAVAGDRLPRSPAPCRPRRPPRRGRPGTAARRPWRRRRRGAGARRGCPARGAGRGR